MILNDTEGSRRLIIFLEAINYEKKKNFQKIPLIAF